MPMPQLQEQMLQPFEHWLFFLMQTPQSALLLLQPYPLSVFPSAFMFQLRLFRVQAALMLVLFASIRLHCWPEAVCQDRFEDEK
jgi:hypothetical protein